jgi:hypothetical protein
MKVSDIVISLNSTIKVIVNLDWVLFLAIYSFLTLLKGMYTLIKPITTKVT